MATNADIDRLPANSSALASWFVEAVRAEIAALETNGGTQNYEVLAGRLIEKRSENQAVFRFIIADGTRIPEEAAGKLKTSSQEYTATVIGQQADRIDLCVEGEAPLPPGIHRATLIVDDTALLRKLAQVLDEIVENPALVGRLAVLAFHANEASAGFADLPATSALVKLKGEYRRAVEQACGSTLTYIWGPPGTGKTYTIAHLITALIESGERVLVSSHTHAAVDQALYEAVKSEGDKNGPLATHPAILDGKILRIGITTDEKIPPGVRLDTILEAKGRELADRISSLERKAKPFVDQRALNLAVIAEWDQVAELSKRLREQQLVIVQQHTARKQAEAATTNCNSLLQHRRAELQRAQQAWFRRSVKTTKAYQMLQETEDQLRRAEQAVASSQQEIAKARRLVSELEAAITHQQTVCARLPPRESTEQELFSIALELEPLEQEIRTLQEELSQLESKIISEAQAIFCTLTKSYTGRELEGQSFDAVIVDEISMALPPLIFLAAGRATGRVILVGDFWQLPPIVRGAREDKRRDTAIVGERLGTDTFHLARVALELKPDPDCRVLAKLKTQRRMRPAIADVARHLAYAGDLADHPEVGQREPLDWLGFLPATASY